MIYLELFWSFFQIGLFSIGGGYAAMPLIQNQVVDIHPWLTMTQFADIMTIAEMTPGPIAINSATFVGIQVAGLPGAVAACHRPGAPVPVHPEHRLFAGAGAGTNLRPPPVEGAAANPAADRPLHSPAGERGRASFPAPGRAAASASEHALPRL